jgi:hypothetical protein
MSVEYYNFKIVKIIKYLIDSCVFYTLSIVTCCIWFLGVLVCVYKLSNPFVLGNAMCYIMNSWFI